jgi:hypothetical protein
MGQGGASTVSSARIDGNDQMKWTIECADPHTGKESVITVDADTRAAAENEVRRRGLMIGAVMGGAPAKEKPPPTSPPRTAPLQGGGGSSAPPKYRALAASARALNVLAYISYPGALFWVMRGMSIAAERAENMVVRAMQQEQSFLCFVYAVSCVVGAIVFHASSAALLALRDIARNSFDRR